MEQRIQLNKLLHFGKSMALSILVSVVLLLHPAQAQNTAPRSPTLEIGTHELSRPARPWEFLDAVGKHAALLGNEAGRFEAWIYPLKLFRDFDLTFVLNNRRIPAASLVRTITMHPEGPTLTFSSD